MIPARGRELVTVCMSLADQLRAKPMVDHVAEAITP